MLPRKSWLILALAASLTACSGGADEGQQEDTAQPLPPELKEMIACDLSSHGLPFSIMIPDSTVGELQIMEQSWGAREITVGKYFQVQIAEAMGGDMERRRKDLSEDLIYKVSYVVDEPDAILYKKEIEASGMEPEFHFYVIRNVNGVNYEIQNIDSEKYPEGAANKMFLAAKNIIAKQAKV